MLPRLEAEEQIEMTNSTALATGSMEKSLADTLRRRLSERAAGERQRPIHATPDDLRSMGIGVRHVKPATGHGD